MGFSLRNLLHEAVAQANPWDGGQTAHTVAINNPVHTNAMPATNNFQRAWDQVNPFDNGRTWQQPTPVREPLSVIHQFTHNGITNAAGDIVHSITNVPAAPVNLLRGMASQYIMHNPENALKDYSLAQSDARNNLVTGIGQQLAGTGQGLYDVIGKESAAMLTGNQQAEDNANTAAVHDFNKTPFGQLFDPLQHKLAEVQVQSQRHDLTPEQQQQLIKQREATVGLDPNASMGKQTLTGGLAALQLATTDKVVNGVPIKEDVAAKAAATKAAVPKIIQAAQDSKVPQIISQAGHAATDTAHDIVTGKPYRNISDAELAGAAKVRHAAMGFSSPMDLTEQDMAHYYSVMKKAGGNSSNDIAAVDDALGKRRTYNTRQSYNAHETPNLGEEGFVRIPGRKTELMATHNLSEDNLAHAHNLGGIPQASVAIVDPTKHALDGYGDITLVGNEKMVDPKLPRNSTYASDVYSPRQPRAELNVPTTKPIIDHLSNEIKQTGEDPYNIEKQSIENSLADSPAAKARYLKENGITPDLSAKGDRWQLRLALDKQMEAHGLANGYNDYVRKLITDNGGEHQIFSGTDSYGRPRYIPETMDNVLKNMRKETLRGGEDTGGLGNIRSHVTPKFKSLEEIYKNKDKLTDTETMTAIKQTLEDKMFKIQDQLDQHAINRNDNQFTEFDSQMSAIRDYLAGGKNAQWFHQKFPNAPASALKSLDNFKKELQHAPTEYFESVPNRAVQLSEFEKAIVPENASQNTLALLKQHGIKPTFYNPAKDAKTAGMGDLGDALAEDSKSQPGLTRQEALQQLMAEDNKQRGLSGKLTPLNEGGYVKNPFADPSNTDPLIEKGKQALGMDKHSPQPNIDAMSVYPSDHPMPADFLQQDPKQIEANKATADAQAAANRVKQQAESNAQKATGVVDKQLQEIEKARKDVVNYTANEIREANKTQPGGVRDQIGQRSVYVGKGGLPEDYQSLPNHMRTRDASAKSLDEWATDLGYGSESDLLDAIEKNAPKKPMTKAEALAEAEKQLESGNHAYSADYQQIKDAMTKRQDELSQYPNGKYRQVTVTDKPAPMSNEELASLSQQPEAQVKPSGRKVVEPAPNTEIRNADAERQVIDDLKGNKGTDTAIENYMKATGVTLQKAVKDINRVAREADIHTDLGKNPIEGKVLLPKVEEGDWKQATLNSRFVQSKELELGGKALDSYRTLSPKDQVLLKDIETGTVRQVAQKAENPKAFTQAEHDIRNYYDHRHAYDRALGIDVGYRTNYLRQLFDRVDEEKQAATGDEQLHTGGGNKNPGYTKERSFDTLGADVGNALQKDIKGSSFNHAKLAYEKGLNEAFPGKIANGEIPRSTNAGVYQQIDHPFGNDLSAPKDIAHEINSRVWHQNDSKALDVYDKLNHGFKYVKLSGGLFHAFTESGNFLGQQLASGKLLTDPAATGRMAQIFFSQRAMESELSRMSDHGVLDKAHLAGLTTTPREILADANVSALDKTKAATSAAAKYTGIKAMHDATFKREIPYAKLKIFEQKTEGLDPAKPADLAKMRDQAMAINNLFGGINREVQGMKPGTFKWVQRALLATDFTEGKWVTLAKAMSDKGEAGTLARQAVVGKALIFGLIATAGAALGGDYQGKSKGQIAKDAAGNLLDPSFEMGGYKVGLPKTHISEAIGAVKPTQNNGKAWNASGLLTYGQDRAAALPSEAIQLLSNKNYYGQPLYGTNTKKNGGGKISPEQAGSNIAQTVLPIPVGQAATTAQGKQNPAAAVANVIGFKAKPNKDNSVTLQGITTQLNDKQSEAYHGQVNTTLKSMQQQLTSSDAYKNANPNDQAKMMSDLKSNVTSAISRDFAGKNNLGQYAPDFTGKDKQATAKEQDILSGKINPDAYLPNSGNNDSYQVSQFKKSNKQTQQIGNDTYYKTSDGTVKHQATFDYNTGIQSAKVDFALDRAKASDNYAGWAQAAQQKYDLIQKQIDHLNPNSQQADILKLKKQQADLVDTAQKYSSYGGFKKPKSGKSRLNELKNSYTPFSIKTASSSNNSLRSMLTAAHISAPGSGRRFKAKQVVKVA